MLNKIIYIKNEIEKECIGKSKITRKLILLKNYVKHVRSIVMEETFVLTPCNLQAIIFMIGDKYFCKNLECLVSTKNKNNIDIVFDNRTISLTILNDRISFSEESEKSKYRTDIITSDDTNYNKKINRLNKMIKSIVNELVADYFLH